MADEPEDPDEDSVEPEDESSEEEDEDSAGEDAAEESEISALAELALCENLSQTSGWAARWSASMAGADGALLWAPDTVHPLFLCIGAHGEGLEKILRRSIPRESGLAHDLVRDRSAIALDRDEILSTDDPFLRGVPRSTKACLAVPLEAEGLVVGLLALLFERTTDTEATLERLEGFIQHAAPALGRALRSERKTVGMLHAIERLTNLYDLSKAFGSTIDTDELAELVVRKAADFATAEVASLWLLDSDEGEVSLAATAVNDNYDVEAPEHVGASVIGDVVADQAAVRRNRIPESDPAATENEGYTLEVDSGGSSDRGRGLASERSPWPTSAAAIRSSRPRTRSSFRISAGRPSGRCGRRASTRPRRRSRSSTPSSRSAARSPPRWISTRS